MVAAPGRCQGFDMTDCVIFDLDGTLVDSEHLCSLGLEIELRRFGIDETAGALAQRYRGWQLAKICAAIEQRHGIALDAAFVPAYRRTVEALFEEHLRPMPGAHDMLRALSLPACVASSAPQAKIRHALSLTGLLPFFEGRIFSAYDIGSWKPDPGLFLHAARIMGSAPADCAVVEDSEVGIQAARAAGMRAVWLSGTSYGALPPGVRRVQHLRELPGVLGLPIAGHGMPQACDESELHAGLKRQHVEVAG